jgi:hypothetical protein
MATVEKLVNEIKQLPVEEQKRLFGILQQEVDTSREATAQSAEPINLDAVDLELKWLMENGWVLERHRGEYIALKGNQLIAHGTLGEVLAESKRRGIDQPFTQYIPKTEKEWLLGQGNYPLNGEE